MFIYEVLLKENKYKHYEEKIFLSSYRKALKKTLSFEFDYGLKTHYSFNKELNSYNDDMFTETYKYSEYTIIIRQHQVF